MSILAHACTFQSQISESETMKGRSMRNGQWLCIISTSTKSRLNLHNYINHENTSGKVVWGYVPDRDCNGLFK